MFGKNPGFLANTFSTSQIMDEVKKVKLPSHKGFSDSDRVAKKMDKVELNLIHLENWSFARRNITLKK
ncbi:hypothetical protein IQ246_25660 [aff. Roholtiella sp. LEGE 12411]|nr:hypothetical protein [aff. Roholtiella sp. LEGE 12411]